MGYCAGKEEPGYTNPEGRMGMARGGGGRGRGAGRGRGRGRRTMGSTE